MFSFYDFDSLLVLFQFHVITKNKNNFIFILQVQ